MRRGILSTISSIYDPIGFAATLMLQGKSILQELCNIRLGWDDLIPEGTKMRWEKLKGELMKLQSITIPRSYKPKDCGHVVRTELHDFSYASVQGYGQCSYLRLVDDANKAHCTFVMEKIKSGSSQTYNNPEARANCCCLFSEDKSTDSSRIRVPDR